MLSLYILNKGGLNAKIFFYLNHMAGKSILFDKMVVFCGHYLPYILIVVVVLMFSITFFSLDGEKTLETTRFVVTIGAPSFILATIFTKLIRIYHYSPRPFVNNPIRQLLYHSDVSSFPSMHATFFFTLATVICVFNKKKIIDSKGHPLLSKSWPFFIGAILISIARVIGGVHWPADVVAGAVLGIFSVEVIYFVVSKVFKKF